MNSSDLRRTACTYLGCYGEPTAQMLEMVDECLAEAKRLSHFRAVGKEYTQPLPFLEKEPYQSFLAGCTEYALVAMTLGAEAERRVRALMTLDPARAVVLDACASALVEYEADLWEERFGKDRTFRFCPGYGGTSITDNAFILEVLNASRIGIELLPSGMMAPQKSMAGIIGLGKRTRKTCKDCMAAAGCQFRKEGRTCYRSENDC